MKYGVSGFIKSLREVPTILLMRLVFAATSAFGMPLRRPGYATTTIDGNFNRNIKYIKINRSDMSEFLFRQVTRLSP